MEKNEIPIELIRQKLERNNVSYIDIIDNKNKPEYFIKTKNPREVVKNLENLGVDLKAEERKNHAVIITRGQILETRQVPIDDNMKSKISENLKRLVDILDFKQELEEDSNNEKSVKEIKVTKDFLKDLSEKVKNKENLSNRDIAAIEVSLQMFEEDVSLD